jgi:putative aldouronate transport system permease protein
MGGWHMVISTSDKWFNTLVYLILLGVGIISLFPILYVISMSVTPYSEVIKQGGFLVIPRSITFDAYEYLLSRNVVPRALGVSILITVLGTFISMLLSTLGAYPLSRKQLPGRTYFLLLIVFTMLFSGGMIPTYLIVKSLGMLNTLWALMIPGAIATFNLLIMKSFFEALPEELFESARMDGATEFRILWQIVIPLSIPSVMTVGLFYMVAQWNSFFAAILYINDQSLLPLQVIVRDLLISTQVADGQSEMTIPTVTVQMAAVMIACLPILLVFPFIQKYFNKGMLLGAIKG